MTWRGELAGYTGTLILEEVDEDNHVARYRFQGTRDGTTATATITVTAGDVRAEVHPGHGSDLTADQLVAAAGGALAAAGEAPRAEVAPLGDGRPTQPAVSAGLEAPPAHDAARRRRALVAAGAAAALTAWALRGRK
jgi:hypothetical protein